MTEPRAWQDDHAKELFTYERLMARSIQSNAMQWQAPSLALTAQAFLLSIALRPDREPGPTTIVCVVGVLITAMAWQLMGRHRYYFHLDRAEMLHLEQALGLGHISDRQDQAEQFVDVRAPRLGSLSSFTVWRVGFLLIAVIDVAIAVTAWWQPRSPWEWRIIAATVAVGLLAQIVWRGRRLLEPKSRA